MRRRIAAVRMMAMLGGCMTYQGSRTAAKVGGYSLLGSVVVGAATLLVLSQRHGNEESGPINVLILDSLAFEFGAVLGVSGLIGMLIHDKPDEPPPAPEPLPDPSVVARARAMDLAKQAVVARYARDCAAVRRREAEVREIDPEFHATVFVHVAVIKRCLDAETQPAIPVTADPPPGAPEPSP